MEALYLSGNQFSGTVQLSALPSTLTVLSLTYNQFCGASSVVQVKCALLGFGCANETKPQRHCANTDTTPNITCPPCISTARPPPSELSNINASSSTNAPDFTLITVHNVAKRNTHVTLTTTTTSIISVGGALLIVPPEVVVSTQMIHIVSQCKQARSLVATSGRQDSSGSPLQRPILSLGRIFPMRLNGRGDDYYEFVMLNVTVSTLYIIHFIL
eukprot:PhF_6_TR16590/c1_g2_i1/m.25281